jgi:hypothetical protein
MATSSFLGQSIVVKHTAAKVRRSWRKPCLAAVIGRLTAPRAPGQRVARRGGRQVRAQEGGAGQEQQQRQRVVRQ